MSNLDKLKELVETLKPNYGAVGSRDVDVTAKRSAADEIVEALEATQQRVAEITGKYEEVSGWYAKMKTRMLSAEAELARRDVAAGESDYYIHRVEVCDSYGPDVELRAFNNALDASKCKDDHGGEVVELFTAAQPAALPKEIPAAFYKVLYDECGGFVDCTADASKIWAAFRKLAKGFTVEGDTDE